MSQEVFQIGKMRKLLKRHVGAVNSAHNQAQRDCDALINQNRSIQVVLVKYSVRDKADYRMCLIASVDCIRFLLRQGLAFRGHDESQSLKNQENFLELVKFLGDHSEGI